MQILKFDLSDMFLPRVADYPGVQRIAFLSFKPAKREQIAETVVTDLLTIFAQVKSEGSRRLMYMYVCMYAGVACRYSLLV